MRKILGLGLIIILIIGCISGCEVPETSGSVDDTNRTIQAASSLQDKQPTPTDIEYSIPRYLLTRRAYFVNGERDKARTLPCPIADMPLGHIVLLTDNGSVVGKFVVEGMVISLNTYLTPDSEFYEKDLGYSSGKNYDSTYAERYSNKWLADVDGTYGMNDSGIFFFTPDGLYMEWSGSYLYTDMPIEIDDPIVRVE